MQTLLLFSAVVIVVSGQFIGRGMQNFTDYYDELKIMKLMVTYIQEYYW